MVKSKGECTMRMYIDIAECKDTRGRVVAAMPVVGIEVDVDEGYNIDALRHLKHELQTMLEDKL